MVYNANRFLGHANRIFLMTCDICAPIDFQRHQLINMDANRLKQMPVDFFSNMFLQEYLPNFQPRKGVGRQIHDFRLPKYRNSLNSISCVIHKQTTI